MKKACTRKEFLGKFPFSVYIEYYVFTLRIFALSIYIKYYGSLPICLSSLKIKKLNKCDDFGLIVMGSFYNGWQIVPSLGPI